jgi:hypothetical protein
MFSIEDNRELSRVSAISGHDIASTEKAIHQLNGALSWANMNYFSLGLKNLDTGIFGQ